MEGKYKGYRTPASIIGYAVRRYYRYKLSLRDISEMWVVADLLFTRFLLMAISISQSRRLRKCIRQSRENLWSLPGSIKAPNLLRLCTKHTQTMTIRI